MYIVSFDVVRYLSFVKYDLLSLCVGLCATLMLKGHNNLALFSNVLFIYVK